jgi:Spy/CpxP family protein refolding chaperone
MKKIISFFIIVICAFAASAQIQRTKPVNSKFDSATIATQVAPNEVTKSTTKQNRELFKELDLSRTQMKQLKEMRQDAKTKKQTIESNTKLSDAETKQQTREFKKGQLKRMQQILTPEQLSKLKAFKKDETGLQMDDMEIDN